MTQPEVTSRDKLKVQSKVRGCCDTSSNSREARQSIKPMINVPHQGRGKASLNLQVSEGLEMANQLNTLFCCFDSGSRNDCPVELPSSRSYRPHAIFLSTLERGGRCCINFAAYYMLIWKKQRLMPRFYLWTFPLLSTQSY